MLTNKESVSADQKVILDSVHSLTSALTSRKKEISSAFSGLFERSVLKLTKNFFLNQTYANRLVAEKGVRLSLKQALNKTKLDIREELKSLQNRLDRLNVSEKPDESLIYQTKLLIKSLQRLNTYVDSKGKTYFDVLAEEMVSTEESVYNLIDETTEESNEEGVNLVNEINDASNYDAVKTQTQELKNFFSFIPINTSSFVWHSGKRYMLKNRSITQTPELKKAIQEGKEIVSKFLSQPGKIEELEELGIEVVGTNDFESLIRVARYMHTEDISNVNKVNLLRFLQASTLILPSSKSKNNNWVEIGIGAPSAEFPVWDSTKGYNAYALFKSETFAHPGYMFVRTIQLLTESVTLDGLSEQAILESISKYKKNQILNKESEVLLEKLKGLVISMHKETYSIVENGDIKEKVLPNNKKVHIDNSGTYFVYSTNPLGKQGIKGAKQVNKGETITGITQEETKEPITYVIKRAQDESNNAFFSRIVSTGVLTKYDAPLFTTLYDVESNANLMRAMKNYIGSLTSKNYLLVKKSYDFGKVNLSHERASALGVQQELKAEIETRIGRAVKGNKYGVVPLDNQFSKDENVKKAFNILEGALEDKATKQNREHWKTGINLFAKALGLSDVVNLTFLPKKDFAKTVYFLIKETQVVEETDGKETILVDNFKKHVEAKIDELLEGTEYEYFTDEDVKKRSEEALKAGTSFIIEANQYTYKSLPGSLATQAFLKTQSARYNLIVRQFAKTSLAMRNPSVKRGKDTLYTYVPSTYAHDIFTRMSRISKGQTYLGESMPEWHKSTYMSDNIFIAGINKIHAMEDHDSSINEFSGKIVKFNGEDTRAMFERMFSAAFVNTVVKSSTYEGPLYKQQLFQPEGRPKLPSVEVKVLNNGEIDASLERLIVQYRREDKKNGNKSSAKYNNLGEDWKKIIQDDTTSVKGKIQSLRNIISKEAEEIVQSFKDEKVDIPKNLKKAYTRLGMQVPKGLEDEFSVKQKKDKKEKKNAPKVKLEDVDTVAITEDNYENYEESIFEYLEYLDKNFKNLSAQEQVNLAKETKLIPKNLKARAYDVKTEHLLPIVERWYANHLINQHFLSQLVLGNLDHFKSSNDILKRMAGVLAPRLKPYINKRHGVSKKYNTLVLSAEEISAMFKTKDEEGNFIAKDKEGVIQSLVERFFPDNSEEGKKMAEGLYAMFSSDIQNENFEIADAQGLMMP